MQENSYISAGGTDTGACLRRAEERLLALLLARLEAMEPEELDFRTVRSISSTLKDLREELEGAAQEAGKLTVVLEGEVEAYAN